MNHIVVIHRGLRREQVDGLARDLYCAEFVAEAVDDDLFALFDDAEDDGASLRIGERTYQLRDSRSGWQHCFVFQLLGFGLTDTGQDVLSNGHSAIRGTVEYLFS